MCVGSHIRYPKITKKRSSSHEFRVGSEATLLNSIIEFSKFYMNPKKNTRNVHRIELMDGMARHGTKLAWTTSHSRVFQSITLLYLSRKRSQRLNQRTVFSWFNWFSEIMKQFGQFSIHAFIIRRKQCSKIDLNQIQALRRENQLRELIDCINHLFFYG